MPIEPPPAPPRPVWRFTFAITAAFLLAQIWAWPLAFAMPVFAAMLLAAPGPMPIRAALRLALLVALILGTGLVLAGWLLAYPLVFCLLLILTLMATFRFAAGGGGALLVIFMLIAALLLPLLAQGSLSLASQVAGAIWFDLVLAMVVSWLAFHLWPAGAAAPATPPAAGKTPDKAAV